MVSVLEATVSLAIQIVVLALLIVAVAFKNRKKFREHGILMITSVVLHIITILTVMVPSFRVYFYFSPQNTGTIVIDASLIITIIHVALGLIAVTLGIWLTASWHLKTDLQRCFANKKLMKPTLTIWVPAILLGIFLYITIWATTLQL